MYEPLSCAIRDCQNTFWRTSPRRKYCDDHTAFMRSIGWHMDALIPHGSIEAYLEAQRQREQSFDFTVIDGELWHPVRGYDCLYHASDQGRLYSVASGRIMRGTPTKWGRVMTLSRPDQSPKKILLNRIIKSTFHPRPHAHRFNVIHENKDVHDNRLVNLKWMLPVGVGTSRAKLREEDIPQIWALWRQGMIYKELAARFGVAISTISNIISGETWVHVARDLPVEGVEVRGL